MPQKRLVRIEMCRDTEKSVYMSVSPSDNVLSIKQRLESLTGIPVLSQTLYLAATQLTDSTSLNEFSISPVTNLNLHIPIRGGARWSSTGFQPFLFHDVTSEDCFEKKKLGHGNKSYLCIDKGLSFQAKCANLMCESKRNGNCVYISKGMYPDHGGYVSIRSEVFALECPACSQYVPAANWENIVFTNCTALIKWRLVDDRNGETLLVTEEGMFNRAKPSVELLNYHMLDVILK